MSQTYPSSLYQTISAVEDTHFWFTSRNRMIVSFIRATIRGPYDAMTFLEIGCGTGIVMATLERLGFIATGLDINEKALFYAVKRTKGTLIRQSIFGFKSKKRFDIVGAFDVLEHIQDDRGFLKACHSLLRPKGYILLTVPSGMSLWSPVDTLSGHVRRYEYEELLQKLTDAGFTVNSLGYWNSLLLPIYSIWHKQAGLRLDEVATSTQAGRKNKDVVSSHLQKMPFIINILLIWIFQLELILSRFIRFPFGATLVVCAQKGNTK